METSYPKAERFDLIVHATFDSYLKFPWNVDKLRDFFTLVLELID